MRALAVLAVLLPACSFSGPGVAPFDGGADGDAAPDGPVDAPVDAPPASPLLVFTAIVADATALTPGQYGWRVTATLRNDADEPVTAVAVQLAFATGGVDRSAQLRVRSPDRRDGVMAPPPTTIAAGAAVAFDFVVDAMAGAAPPGPLEINGVATAIAAGTPVSATPLATPTPVPFAPNLRAPIVVNTAEDELAPNNLTSLREAMATAASVPGFDRIVFDPAVFPVGAQPATTILLDEALGELPIVADDLVLDASEADVVLAVDAAWATVPGRLGLRHTGGRLVVHGIRFRNFAYGYRELPVDADNCNGGDQLAGGAIGTAGGTLILESNSFTDPAVPERNCYQAAVRIAGGSGHRLRGNAFTDVAADAIYINAPVVEIANNLINGGPTPTKGDDGIFINSQGGAPLWVIGNIIADQDFSGLLSATANSGPLFVQHNVFARNGRAVQRNGSAPIELRNNVYLDQDAAAIVCPTGTGTLNLAFETTSGNVLFDTAACGTPVVDAASMIAAADLLLTQPAMPINRVDFTPTAGSPLVGAGTPGLDRNGAAPGWSNGAGPERGAVELP